MNTPLRPAGQRSTTLEGNGLINGISRAISSGMTATITIDASGRLVLPRQVREKLHLHAGSKLSLSVVAGKVELTPQAEQLASVVRKGRRLVIEGIEAPFDAASAVKNLREERNEKLVRRTRQ